jgi:chromosome segregation ATPase
MVSKQAYQEQLEARLLVMQTEIDQLNAKLRQAERALDEYRVDFYSDSALEEMKEYFEEIRLTLYDLKAANDEVWQPLKAGTGEAWDTFNDNLTDIHHRIK